MRAMVSVLSIIIVVLLVWSLIYDAGVEGVPNPVHFFKQAYAKARVEVEELIAKIKSKLMDDEVSEQKTASTDDSQKEEIESQNVENNISSDPPKAVVVLGSDLDQTTAAESNEELDKTASVLQPEFIIDNFRWPNDQWPSICGALQGAEIMVYAGHGLGTDGTATKNRGLANGLCVDGSYFEEATGPYSRLRYSGVSQEQIISSVRFEPGGLAILHGACYACGPWSNELIIDYGTAYRRVNDYSYTFLSVGADYLALNISGLDELMGALEKNPDKPIGKALEEFCSTHDIELTKARHSDYPNSSLWLGLSRYYNEYVIAFAGDPNITYNSLLH